MALGLLACALSLEYVCVVKASPKFMFCRLTEGPLSQMRHRSERSGLLRPICRRGLAIARGGMALQSINDAGSVRESFGNQDRVRRILP